MEPKLVNVVGALRRACGWSQAHVAELAGITRQSYAAIETGRSVPSAEVALRLAQAFGRPVEELFRLPARATPSWTVRAVGVRVGGRARLARVGGDWLAYPLGESDRPARRADAEVLAIEGGQAEVRLLPERPPEPSLVVLGCDPAFGVVAEALRAERGIEVFWTQRGSRAALEALAKGESHVAGLHLRDPRTGEYNGPWVRRLVPFPCTRVSFAVWEEGLLVSAGNPLGIAGIQDLIRPELRFLNREPGSGSRTLIEDRLRAAGLDPERVRGYGGPHARSHLAAAEAVATGLADAAVGIRAAGLSFGLHVIGLAAEPYDLVIPDHFLDLPAVQALLGALRRPGIRRQVESMGGYDVAIMGAAA